MDNPLDVDNELQRISNEIQFLMDASEGSSFKATPEHRTRFKELKERIALGAQMGTITGEKRELTDSEEFIYQPALQNALSKFNIASNAAPSRWFETLYDVKCSIETMLIRNTP
ncbi:hypothetical protein [Vreelandella populi]|uniref:hypothetical protein n=1 Tax=Vreelandella populi TaxID=2498858 RepID=UPI000F8DADDB|nr:hypothetical protein [Halomonas populi]RUR51515.1 hypothetical protein ELY40_17110 [Halomonas populi]